ncbi:DUF983 domain-containing protein [Phenylobacterium sp. CCH12-B4]|jgi:uncharacterized protein (DUF983 family)|uniref:DUF983 domain-containing protein n=2 Tax=unclassified Phenylobacterium TaxID=2640670 RepID=UPI000839E8C5|nr:DUF983 domain-containing protein [Phenylobacterium sp. CCH12-B4]
MGAMAEFHHPLFRSIGRGLSQHCPCCGKGRLFGRYLKVQPACEACGHDLARYPADDGPAYLTILLVGHLIVAPMLFFPVVWETSPLYSLPIILGALTALTLLVLPRVKGGWIGIMYALQSTDREHRLHTADAAD